MEDSAWEMSCGQVHRRMIWPEIERDWMLAQARIDELTETGKQAIQRLVQDITNRAEGEDATPDQELAEA